MAWTRQTPISIDSGVSDLSFLNSIVNKKVMEKNGKSCETEMDEKKYNDRFSSPSRRISTWNFIRLITVGEIGWDFDISFQTKNLLNVSIYTRAYKALIYTTTDL